MLTAVPLPDNPLTILWQSTTVDIEPGSRYGYNSDAASINTTLAIANSTQEPITFPLILATGEAELDKTQRSVRVASEAKELKEAAGDKDAEWEVFAEAVRQNAINQNIPADQIDGYLESLKGKVKRAYKSERVTIAPGEEKFVRSYHRKRLREENDECEFRGVFPLPQFVLAQGGTISVAVSVPRSVQKFSVDLIDWTREFGAQAFGKDPPSQVGGRFVVAWLWGNDPELFVKYRYA